MPRLALEPPGSSSNVRLLLLMVTPADGETATVPVVRTLFASFPAANTLTAKVWAVVKLPVKDSVKTALVVPPAPDPNEVIDTFGIAVTNWK